MTSEFDVKKYQDVINEILPGLTMYVRDVNLSPICAQKYEPGMIIMEPGFTDASNRVMGMVTSHRFAILSNHMGDFRKYEQDTNWGLFVATHGAHFKVLDKFEFQARTQILLLHLPDDSRWKMFDNVKLSIEDHLVEDSRDRFKSKIGKDPVPELTTDVWLDRCSAPLGMDDEGKLFDIDPSLKSQMRPVEGATFRSFYYRFIYVACSGILKMLLGSDHVEDNAGAILYGYIDEQAGLSFQLVKLAILEEHSITLKDAPNDICFIIRYENVKDDMFLDLSLTELDLEQFSDFANEIHEGYDTDNEEKERIRSLEFLDECRHPAFPDDIAVLLLRKDVESEQVWVRGNHITENEIYGELLNEPFADFGVHGGDSIRIIPFEKDDGSIMCVSPQEK